MMPARDEFLTGKTEVFAHDNVCTATWDSSGLLQMVLGCRLPVAGRSALGFNFKTNKVTAKRVYNFVRHPS